MSLLGPTESDMPRGSLVGDDDTELVGTSPLFCQVLSIVDSVAGNDCVVLIEGESGTGKELIARRVHQRSGRAEGPFVPVNCPSISESLFESQFFGHVKGAFTGAASSTLGMVRAADGGTLMLDEVGELPLHLQPKLLRLLQQREVTPVGSSTPVRVDVRFVAATNRSLAKRVAEGEFRSDLYHRLNVVRIEIPPLRSRPEDIEPLVDYYLDQYACQYAMAVRRLGPSLRKALREYSCQATFANCPATSSGCTPRGCPRRPRGAMSGTTATSPPKASLPPASNATLAACRWSRPPRSGPFRMPNCTPSAARWTQPTTTAPPRRGF